MMALLWIVTVLSVATIVRIVCIAASADLGKWEGSRVRFAALASPYVATCMALVAALFDANSAPLLMILALVLWVMVRRNPFKRPR